MFQSALFLFLFVTVVSFVGSLQLGPVNGVVIRTALTNRRQAWWIALGGALPEVIYSGISLYVLSFLNLRASLANSLESFASFALIGIGLLFIHQSRAARVETLHPYSASAHRGVLNGFSYGITNIQLIVFWITILGYSTTIVTVHQYSVFHVLAVLIGSLIGALCALGAFILLVHRHRELIMRSISGHYIDRGIGILLITIGIAQLIL